MITEDYVRSIFKGLENGDGASFFEHVADDVDWMRSLEDIRVSDLMKVLRGVKAG
jgi:ketosteroid isomerase-like protein